MKQKRLRQGGEHRFVDYLCGRFYKSGKVKCANRKAGNTGGDETSGDDDTTEAEAGTTGSYDEYGINVPAPTPAPGKPDESRPSAASSSVLDNAISATQGVTGLVAQEGIGSEAARNSYNIKAAALDPADKVGRTELKAVSSAISWAKSWF